MMLRRKHTTLGNRPASLERRGAAAVEFALILPLFLVLIVGTIELGRAYEVSQLMHLSVRDAARMASTKFPQVTVTNTRVIDSVRNTLIAGGVPVTGLTVTITHAETGAAFDVADADNSLELFRVTATLPFNQANYTIPMFMNNRNVVASIAMRMRPTFQDESTP